MSDYRLTAGQWLQLAGFVSFAAGAVLSFHHYLLGGLFVGGAAAWVLGEKLRTR